MYANAYNRARSMVAGRGIFMFVKFTNFARASRCGLESNLRYICVIKNFDLRVAIIGSLRIARIMSSVHLARDADNAVPAPS